MKAIIEKAVTITLVLEMDEAIWLKNVMQNPLYVCHPDNEDKEDYEMRQKFFNAITDSINK
jgi:hypothetical protein